MTKPYVVQKDRNIIKESRLHKGTESKLKWLQDYWGHFHWTWEPEKDSYILFESKKAFIENFLWEVSPSDPKGPCKGEMAWRFHGRDSLGSTITLKLTLPFSMDRRDFSFKEPGGYKCHVIGGNVLLRHDPFYKEENHWILAIGKALSTIKKIWIRELDHLHAQSKKTHRFITTHFDSEDSL